MATTETPSAERGARVFAVAGVARFTVLTEALIRLEHAPDGVFEDRPTMAFPDRGVDLGPVSISLADAGGGEIDASAFGESGGVLETEELILRYDPSAERGGAFTEKSLSIELKREPRTVWTPGADASGNLGGTVRTLDNISGACPVERGLLSRDGWAVHDDSAMPVLETPGDGGASWRGEPWAASRDAHEGAVDWYFFGYGREYTRCLGDYTRLAGRIPVPPRYVLGVWWSRYWRYTDTQLKEIVTDFDRHGVPLDVLVIDMDWHLPGWTGYTWDRSCFPEPGAFLDWCHAHGLAVTLNLHPADGVGRHEEMFLRMREAVGGDRTMYRVPFDCTDPVFVSAYFELLHHPLEAQGVDFWWMDWQQGTETAVENLDPLPWLNHLHWRDMALNPARLAAMEGKEARHKRPLVFSRWGGLGGHRYPIGFSGDTYNDWASLAFQPWFTATASNVGFGYWSHDIGGHQPGPVEPELYARWIQYGVLSPVVRTHAGNRADAERRVWKFPERMFEVAKEAFGLRYAIAPYIYGAMREAYDTGVSLCRPMYYDHPDLDEAYEHGGQYFFGPDMIAAPVVSPADEVSGRAVVRVWLPCGGWTSWCGGRTYEVEEEGGREVAVSCELDEIPLFVRSGAVVPTVEPAMRMYEGAPPRLALEVFPFGRPGGAEWTGSVYDDDGISDAYQRGECARTPITHEREGRTARVTIGPAEGAFPGFGPERDYEIRLRESVDAEGVTAAGERLSRIDAPKAGAAPARGYWYDEASRALRVSLPGVRVGEGVSVEVELAGDAALERELRSGLRGRERRAAKLPGDGSLGDFCRRFGVCCTLEATPIDERRVRVRFEVDHAPDAPDAEPIAVRVSFGGLSCFGAESGGLESVSATVDADGSVVREAVLTAIGGVPGNDRVSARVEVTAGGETRTLTPSIDLCPSVNGWHVAGPFAVPFEDALRTAFWPEEELKQNGRVDCSKPAGGDSSWVWTQRPPYAGASNEFVVDFNRALDGPHEYCVAYAATTVIAPRAMRARLAFGSDDGAVIWVNGREVFRHHIQRGYTSREQFIGIDLEKGENQIVVKVNQAEAGWMFGLHIEDEHGDIIPGLRVVGPGVSSG